MKDMLYELLRSDNDTALGKAVGVSHTTIKRWRENPNSVPYGKAELLARIKGYKITIHT